MTWKPVWDKPCGPAESRMVLVCNQHGECGVALFVHDAAYPWQFIDFGRNGVRFGGNSSATVTHWHELPRLPNGRDSLPADLYGRQPATVVKESSSQVDKAAGQGDWCCFGV